MGARSFPERGDGDPEMLLRVAVCPPGRPKGERNSSPALINDDGREKFQCLVAATSDIVVARNVAVLPSLRRAVWSSLRREP